LHGLQARFFAAHGLHAPQPRFFAPQGLQAPQPRFFAAQGLQAAAFARRGITHAAETDPPLPPQGLHPPQGLQGFLPAQGLQGLQARFAPHGLQPPQPRFFAPHGLQAPQPRFLPPQGLQPRRFPPQGLQAASCVAPRAFATGSKSPIPAAWLGVERDRPPPTAMPAPTSAGNSVVDIRLRLNDFTDWPPNVVLFIIYGKVFF
jgi:hypothetical protein